MYKNIHETAEIRLNLIEGTNKEAPPSTLGPTKELVVGPGGTFDAVLLPSTLNSLLRGGFAIEVDEDGKKLKAAGAKPPDEKP